MSTIRTMGLLALACGTLVFSSPTNMSVSAELLLLAFLWVHSEAQLLPRIATTLCLLSVAVFLVAGLAGSVELMLVIQYTLLLLAGALLCGRLSSHEQEHRRTLLRQLETFRQLSEQDGLTHLYNRRKFFEHGLLALNSARRDQCPVSLLLIDVDYFKRFNDRFGHLAGDKALQRIAGKIADAARRPMDMAARVGGEEFGLLLFDTNAAHAFLAAEKLRASLELLPMTTAEEHWLLTVSIGVATCHSSMSCDWEYLFSAADRALYDAKEAGRNAVRRREEIPAQGQ